MINESSKLNVNVLPLVDSQMSLGQIAQQVMPGMDAMGLGAAMGALVRVVLEEPQLGWGNLVVKRHPRVLDERFSWPCLA